MSKSLIERITKETGSRYSTRVDEKGKWIKNVANFGLNPGEMATVARNGEYHGITIEAMERIKPILTNLMIIRAVKHLANDNPPGAAASLHLKDEVKKHGYALIYTVMVIWLEKVGIEPPTEYYQKRLPKFKDEIISEWAIRNRSQPIVGRFKVVGVGESKKAGHSVVPDDWLGREFASGEEMHKEMDELDWRKGKPPVHYCSVYSMSIMNSYRWLSWDERDATPWIPEIIVRIKVDKDFGNIRVWWKTNLGKNFDFPNWLNKQGKSMWFRPGESRGRRVLVVCRYKRLFTTKPKYTSSYPVGVLVSRIQKAIRRGEGGAKVLLDTIRQLAKAPPYNLPDQQFARVSATRQLVWRLFITCIEDSAPLRREGIGLGSLGALAVVCTLDTDLQLRPKMIDRIAEWALLVQKNTTKPTWRKMLRKKGSGTGLLDTVSIEEQTIESVLECMPMMTNDGTMLRAMARELATKEVPEADGMEIEDLVESADDKIGKAIILASYDMHCIPGMILDLQSLLPKRPTDDDRTYLLSAYIWENSSKWNIRLHPKFNSHRPDLLKVLQWLQAEYHHVYSKSMVPIKLGLSKIGIGIDFHQESDNAYRKKEPIDALASRTAFIRVFGRSERFAAAGKLPSIEVVVAGSVTDPIKVKKTSARKGSVYLDGADKEKGCERYLEMMAPKAGAKLPLPDPPEGYEWAFDQRGLLKASVVKSKTGWKFTYNGIKMNPMDGSPLIRRLPGVKEQESSRGMLSLLAQIGYREPVMGKHPLPAEEVTAVCRQLHTIRRKHNHFTIYEWTNMMNLPGTFWRAFLAKLENRNRGTLVVGPVDRTGKRVHEAISYRWEGTMLRIANMLSMLYPDTVTPTGRHRFAINSTTSSYLDLKHRVTQLSKNDEELEIDLPAKAKVATQLWEHQLVTKSKMVDGMINLGRRGFGDASAVGSGKTLTALSLIVEIMNRSIDSNDKHYRGFVILLPTTKLYKTWEDEIDKHTTGLVKVFQNANGSLTGEVDNLNVVVITTLGRMRDHPLNIPWKLVVIDECLSVQNQEALQTEEAWRQVVATQYGVVMLSATFFRSRFDKMFYMLKMLRSGLPEEKEYLDAILSECMVCHLPEQSRKWLTETTRFDLPNNLRKQYDAIAKKKLDAEKLYSELVKFLFKKYDTVIAFKEMVKRVDKRKGRALIYARSKDEADRISERVANVSRYPDKSKKHVVVSYAEGTYGLNDLVIYDTLITRPPEPDKLPQMKGRLDRPGNKAKVLRLEYFLLRDTIEEAWLLRLEMANNFYQQHILPLADFYEVAVGKKSIDLI